MERRGRPTLRCLIDDLQLAVPSLDVDLGEIEHPFIDELRRITPNAPTGQKRILSIAHPLVYRVRVSSERGATWLEEERSVVWLCAAHRREQDSDDDAFHYFVSLHAAGALLPDDDDRLRDRAEAALRMHRRLTANLLTLVDEALAHPSLEQHDDLGGWIPCRILVQQGAALQEVWCALSTRATDDSHVPEAVRDLLFASLEQHLQPAVSEPCHDWPSGPVEWCEVVVLNLREP